MRGRPALARARRRAADAARVRPRRAARRALLATRRCARRGRSSASARLLVSEDELRGPARDLRPTIPALARVNRDTIPLLDENRALSACQNQVLAAVRQRRRSRTRTSRRTRGQPFYKQGPRGFVGLAGESRLFDANSPLFHIQFGTGPTTVVYGDRGENFFAQAPEPPAGIRPIRPNDRPKFRPDVPCETQEPPDLNAPGGRPSRSITPGPGIADPRRHLRRHRRRADPVPGHREAAQSTTRARSSSTQVMDYFKRKQAGKPTPRPAQHDARELPQGARRSSGCDDRQGKIVEQGRGRKAKTRRAGGRR